MAWEAGVELQSRAGVTNSNRRTGLPWVNPMARHLRDGQGQTGGLVSHVLKAATTGRELFLAWQQSPSRPGERKALDESLRDVEKAIAAAQDPAAGQGPISMRGSKA